MSTAPIRGKLALVVGGGPAPGINGVISSVTIEAIEQGIVVECAASDRDTDATVRADLAAFRHPALQHSVAASSNQARHSRKMTRRHGDSCPLFLT